MRGRPARLARRSNRPERLSGGTGVPSGWQKTRSSSRNDGPSRRRSSSCACRGRGAPPQLWGREQCCDAHGQSWASTRRARNRSCPSGLVKNGLVKRKKAAEGARTLVVTRSSPAAWRRVCRSFADTPEKRLPDSDSTAPWDSHPKVNRGRDRLGVRHKNGATDARHDPPIHQGSSDPGQSVKNGDPVGFILMAASAQPPVERRLGDVVVPAEAREHADDHVTSVPESIRS